MKSYGYIRQPAIVIALRLYADNRPQADAFLEELEADIRRLVLQQSRQKRHGLKVDWVMTTLDGNAPTLTDGRGRVIESQGS